MYKADTTSVELTRMYFALCFQCEEELLVIYPYTGWRNTSGNKEFIRLASQKAETIFVVCWTYISSGSTK